jgi:hypothetical protein
MNTHRVTEIQLLENDNGKRVIPINTGKVQIGIAYQPKPTAADAKWLEKQTRRSGYSWAWWCAMCGLALAGAVAIALGERV